MGEPHSVAAMTPSCRNLANPKSAIFSLISWEKKIAIAKSGKHNNLAFREVQQSSQKIIATHLRPGILGTAVVVEEDVLGLQVAVDDVL